MLKAWGTQQICIRLWTYTHSAKQLAFPQGTISSQTLCRRHTHTHYCTSCGESRKCLNAAKDAATVTPSSLLFLLWFVYSSYQTDSGSLSPPSGLEQGWWWPRQINDQICVECNLLDLQNYVCNVGWMKTQHVFRARGAPGIAKCRILFFFLNTETEKYGNFS